MLLPVPRNTIAFRFSSKSNRSCGTVWVTLTKKREKKLPVRVSRDNLTYNDQHQRSLVAPADAVIRFFDIRGLLLRERFPPKQPAANFSKGRKGKILGADFSTYFVWLYIRTMSSANFCRISSDCWPNTVMNCTVGHELYRFDFSAAMNRCVRY